MAETLNRDAIEEDIELTGNTLQIMLFGYIFLVIGVPDEHSKTISKIRRVSG